MSKVGEKIRAYRESLGLSRADFAAELGEKPSKIQDVETGKQRTNDIFLTNLANKFPIDIGDLFREKSLPSAASRHSPTKEAAKVKDYFISIQRFDIAASAGHGALAESETGTGHYAFNRSWLTRRGLEPDNLAVIAVRGDSMEPELYDQDLILLDRSQTKPRDGDMYVVRYSGDLFVKRVQVVPGNKVELRSTNRFYGPIMVALPEDDAPHNLELTFIGKVVASMHEW